MQPGLVASRGSAVWPVFVVSWLSRICRRWLSRGEAHARRRRLGDEASLRLTPAHTLHLVRCDERLWLVACHATGVSVLRDWDERGESECMRGAVPR